MFASVPDPHAWSSIKRLYIASGLLFLVTILLGFLNVFQDPELHRWQLLTHLHSGTIGWITMGGIATTLWIFAGDGDGRQVNALSWTAIVAFTGYVASFALGFGLQGGFKVLMPIFGIASAATFIWTFVFVLTHWHQEGGAGTAHALIATGWLIASLGAIFGVLFGLQFTTGTVFFADETAIHFITMDLYVMTLLFGFVEAHTRGTDGGHSWHGWAQIGLMTLGAGLVMVALLSGMEELMGIAFPAAILSIVFYLVRTGWRPFKTHPWRQAHLFWGGIGFIGYIVFFLLINSDSPHWLEIAFVHFLGIGAVTNIHLATQTHATDGDGGWLEPAAAWTMNIGLLAFVGGVTAADVPHGAILMGIGVITAVLAMVKRLWMPQRSPTFVP